jgi:hypothetical protein
MQPPSAGLALLKLRPQAVPKVSGFEHAYTETDKPFRRDRKHPLILSGLPSGQTGPIRARSTALF